MTGGRQGDDSFVFVPSASAPMGSSPRSITAAGSSERSVFAHFPGALSSLGAAIWLPASIRHIGTGDARR